MIILSIEPQNLPVGQFRIFIECAAEMSDVRLSGRGDVYVNTDAPFVVVVDKSGGVVADDPRSTTAYDRADDRDFLEDG